jgi:hypothetical protein
MRLRTHGDDPVQPSLEGLHDLLESLADPLLISDITLYRPKPLPLELVLQSLCHLGRIVRRSVEDGDVPPGLGDGTGESEPDASVPAGDDKVLRARRRKGVYMGLASMCEDVRCW